MHVKGMEAFGEDHTKDSNNQIAKFTLFDYM